jgi:pyruvate kinase
MSARDTLTKVVATLGPASSDPEVIGAMIDAGMDVVRLNFSHGEPGEHRDRLLLARRIADDRGASLAVLADLQGPRSVSASLPAMATSCRPAPPASWSPASTGRLRRRSR